MNLDLTGKVAIVTGSSRGLGLASARALAQEGCRVTICARGETSLEEAAGELRIVAQQPADVLPVVADVSTAAGVETVIARTVDLFGGLDILVNNVGLAKGTDIVGTSDEEWQEAFDQTLFPAVRASRLAVPLMRKRGGGAIVMIASIWGRESGGRMTYNAVKAAEISLAKAMAQQLAGDNIRVNSVAPGSIRFPGGSWDRRVQADPEGMSEFVKRELPFGRFGRPEEVGAVVSFLASPRASWISGASVPVDGCQSRSQI
jgi:3-oxoacyl-[acyl-carrier protein] reductase